MDFEPIISFFQYNSKRWPELFLAIFCLLSLRWYLENKNKVLVHWPILDEIPSLLQNAHRIHEWSVEVANEVGSTIVGKGPIFSRLRLVFTCDPHNVEYIVKTNFANFPKGEEYAETFDVLGNGIFTVDFEYWHAQRKIANKTFASKEFRSFIAKMSRKVMEDSLLPLLSQVAKEATIIDMEDVFLRFAFDSIFTVLFGINPESLSISLEENELAEAIDDATEALFYRHVLPPRLWKLYRWLQIGSEKKLVKAWSTIDRRLGEYILSKKKDMLNGVHENDMIAIYMRAQEQEQKNNDLLPKGDGFLRDTGLSFLFAGRDSTGTSLAWFFWVIATNPSVEAKILEELACLHSNTIVGDDFEEKKPYIFNSEDLKGLVYLHAALCESFRLYPPLPINHKGVDKDDVLPDGTVVKAGFKIFISMYAMGRMEWLWGKDCLEYKPERWIDEHGKLSPIPLSKFYTFNAGPRNCIGRDMAFTQMKLVTAAVVFNYHVEIVEGQIIRPKPSAVLHMKNGLKVRIKERRS
ncbi:hypothetical protein GIB67_013974 [Kingdonia uniflora]|uniref:Cytochrome P450 n=1 Tax=Kingdonia uniflora TaxID=39325 RepID=A0A7J7LDC8_9MAGN|nr:hypothetical protein GIB67_013974 [Kingdonia uniflora]